MSRCYWMFVAALGGLITSSGLANDISDRNLENFVNRSVVVEERERDDNTKEADSDTQNATASNDDPRTHDGEEVRGSAPLVGVKIQTIIDDYTSEYYGPRSNCKGYTIDECDLLAQWFVGRYTRRAAIFAALAFVLTALGTALVFRTFWYTKFNSRHEIRAYIGAEFPHEFNGALAHGTFEAVITIKNSGNSIARNVITRSRVQVFRSGFDKANEFPELKTGTGNSGSVNTIFPGQTMTLEPIYKRRPNNTAVDNIVSGKLRIFVFGAIEYDDIFDKRHLTRFAAVIAADRDGSIAMLAGVKDRGRIRYARCSKHNDAT